MENQTTVRPKQGTQRATYVLALGALLVLFAAPLANAAMNSYAGTAAVCFKTGPSAIYPYRIWAVYDGQAEGQTTDAGSYLATGSYSTNNIYSGGAPVPPSSKQDSASFLDDSKAEVNAGFYALPAPLGTHVNSNAGAYGSSPLHGRVYSHHSSEATCVDDGTGADYGSDGVYDDSGTLCTTADIATVGIPQHRTGNLYYSEAGAYNGEDTTVLYHRFWAYSANPRMYSGTAILTPDLSLGVGSTSLPSDAVLLGSLSFDIQQTPTGIVCEANLVPAATL